jgi:hypothetical protein
MTVAPASAVSRRPSHVGVLPAYFPVCRRQTGRHVTHVRFFAIDRLRAIFVKGHRVLPRTSPRVGRRIRSACLDYFASPRQSGDRQRAKVGTPRLLRLRRRGPKMRPTEPPGRLPRVAVRRRRPGRPRTCQMLSQDCAVTCPVTLQRHPASLRCANQVTTRRLAHPPAQAIQRSRMRIGECDEGHSWSREDRRWIFTSIARTEPAAAPTAGAGALRPAIRA